MASADWLRRCEGGAHGCSPRPGSRLWILAHCHFKERRWNTHPNSSPLQHETSQWSHSPSAWLPGNEFLVMNQFLRAKLANGTTSTRLLMWEPHKLEYGKKVPAILGVCWKNWISARKLGHCGICIEHYAFDRAGFSALDRLVRQWHEQEKQTWRHELHGRHPTVADLTELVVVTACALHDCHNAFKRGQFEGSD